MKTKAHKHTQEMFLFAGKDWQGEMTYNIYSYNDMHDDTRTLIKTFDVEVDVPETDITSALIDKLETKKQILCDAYMEKKEEINEQIESLRALEHIQDVELEPGSTVWPTELCLGYEDAGQFIRTKVGDVFVHDGEDLTVTYFQPPHKSSSSGKISVEDENGNCSEMYVGILNLEWINRSDR